MEIEDKTPETVKAPIADTIRETVEMPDSDNILETDEILETVEPETKLIINWFPGHMHRTRKLIKSHLSRVDMIIEMRDARSPASTSNPLLAELTNSKPILILLNKADMADPSVTQRWIQALKTKDCAILAVNSTDPKLKKKIVSACRSLLPDFNRNGRRQIRAMITGIPNVGKSTLLNTVSSSSKAKTGNRPAITKDIQNVRIPGGVDLLDTPGVLWPKIESVEQGIRLSATGSIRDEVVDLYRIAARTVEIIMKNYPQLLMTRFKVAELPDTGDELLEIIGRKRGCLLKGGRLDLDKAAFIFLTEFREGRIGAISLEGPGDIIPQESSVRNPDEPSVRNPEEPSA